MSTADPRSRLILHLNWFGQALPVLLNGLPSMAALENGSASSAINYHNLPQPSDKEVSAINPYAQILSGTYRTPTFILHGTEDDLIPWQQSVRTYEALMQQGVPAEIRILQGLPHLFDMLPGTDGQGSRAVAEAYNFLAIHAGLAES
jgi:acetyl esterase/lipase